MMEQHTENSSAQSDSPAPAAAEISLGAALREARERLGLSVADVAGQTKLAPRQIEALETENFRHLPEMPFVRGFVRSYAKILHLDAQPLLACLPQVSAESVQLEPVSVEAPFPGAHSPQRQNLLWLGTALLLSVLVVALAVWHFTAPPAKNGADGAAAPAALEDKTQIAPALRETVAASPAAKTEKRAEEEEVAALAAKAKSSPAEPQAETEKTQPRESAPSRSATLRLAFDEESWTEVRDRNDKVLSSQVNPRGSELRLNGQAPFTLVIGHAASARLYYRGKQIDLAPYIGTSNDVARLTLE